MAYTEGESLVALLKTVSYPGAADLDPGSLDWMFHDDRAGAFLQWLVDSVTVKNVVPPGYRQRYEELKAEGKVLQGEALQKAVQSLNEAGDELLSMEDLQKEIDELTLQSKQLAEREQLLQSLTGNLSSQNESLKLRLSSLEKVEESEKQEFLRCLGQCERDHVQVVTVLEDVCVSVEAVAKLYAEAGPAVTTAGGGCARSADVRAFLSQACLDDYNAAELSYSGAVTAYTNKKFFEAIGDLASHKDDDYYTLLEVTDPKALVAHGEQGDDSVTSDCRELLRIQKTYPQSVTHNINSQTDKAYADAALASTAESLAEITNLTKWDEHQLSTEVDTLLGQCTTKKRQIARLREGSLSELLRRSAAASEARILTGNYNLKLARQNYFLASQDQVIEKLLSQRARFELLSMLYEVEARHHRDTHSTVAAVRARLQDALNACRRRMKAMEEASFSESKFERATIDSRSSWLVTAADLLGIDGGAMRPFVTYADLAASAKALCDKLEQSRMRQQQSERRGDTAIEAMDSAVTKAVTTLCCLTGAQPSAADTAALPLDFMPRQLAEVSLKLESDLAALEASVLDLLKAVEQKKKLLKQDPIRKMHRRLFRTFYTEPHNLKSLITSRNDP